MSKRVVQYLCRDNYTHPSAQREMKLERNRQPFHLTPRSRHERNVNGEERPFGLLDPRDKFSVNEELLIVNIFLGKYSLFVSLHNSHIV